MTPLTPSRSIGLSLTLLTLPLMACGTEEGAATPAPEQIRYETVSLPLVADGPPSVRGGTLANRVFHNAHSYESCTNPDPPHCVSYQAALPVAPNGMEIRVAPIMPIVSMTGQPVSYTPEDAPPCVEPLLVELIYSTDAWMWPRSLPADQVAMEKGATKLTVSLCFRGEVRAQLGDLSGRVSYARYQPLHR